MSPLAKYLFMFLINHTGPGKSVYSMELMPECGTDQEMPTCATVPVCISSSPLCSAPRWSAFRGGWVKVETKEEAAKRYLNAAEALADTAVYLTRCIDESGNVQEDCTPIYWPEGPRSAACAILSSSIWESGYREDIMTGAPPAGRGSQGEACLMQVMPQYIADNASWLSSEQKKGLSQDEVVQMVLGTDKPSLSRCYEVGGRLLSRFRRATRTCGGHSWVYAMYSGYGTGGRCRESTWSQDRERTYKTCMARWPDGEKLPDWASSVLAADLHGDSLVAMVE